MEQAEIEHLPAEQQIALSYTPRELHAMLASFFVFDRRLSQIVSNTSEPMLGQMRLAWWREQLGKPVAERPPGDAALDAIGRHWAGGEESLLALVDGWEELLAAERVLEAEATRICQRRAKPLEWLAAQSGRASDDRVLAAGVRWAAADAAAHVAGEEERGLLVGIGLDQPTLSARIPRALRGLAVLEALALRSLRRGGRPLMEGRGAALTALRAGLLGR